MSYPVRYNNKKEQWEVRVGQTRWRKAELQDCWNCGLEFYRPTSEIHNGATRGEGRFCSPECSVAFRVKNAHSNQIIKTCEICHDTFRVKRGHQHRYRTCGKRDCVYAMRVKSGYERWERYHKSLVQ